MPLLAPLLEALLTGLAWLFRNRIGQWIMAALAWFGISWGTYHFAVQPWLNMLQSHVTGIGGGEWGAVAAQWVGVLNFDKACTMVGSAVAAKYGLQSAKAFLVKTPT
jgi:hypothetical protein